MRWVRLIVSRYDRRVGNRALAANTETTTFVICTLHASPLPIPVPPIMSQEPVHGNLSHAMRDNYAEHGVDQVRHPVTKFYFFNKT